MGRSAKLLLPLAVLLLSASVAAMASWQPKVRAASEMPIKHVVVIYQENHSFNELLGWLCDEAHRCEGTETGVLATGESVELRPAPDIAPNVAHSTKAQARAIDGGKMDGFSEIFGCTEARDYACYVRYRPSQIPTLALLSRKFAISDHTFEMDTVPSWGAHLELVAAQLDGFTGDNPLPVPGNPAGPGWGCDSYRDADWVNPTTGSIERVPSCVPKLDGSGPYRTSPVSWVPTIMDRMDDAGLSWRIYTAEPNGDQPLPYGWAICPTFAECVYGPQAQNVLPDQQVVSDAEQGILPSLSLVLPENKNSQHNGWSMLQGDNWIESVVSGVMSGPDWNSTAVFITYDDCGCFYDEVPPPPGLGIRVPMTIVSPYARAGYTDSNVASFASLLAFTEHVFGLEPLSNDDADAYDYSDAFDFSQSPLPPAALEPRPLPGDVRAHLKAHPPKSDLT